MRNNSRWLADLIVIFSCMLIFTSCKKLEKVMMVSTVQVKDVTAGSAKVDGKVIDTGEGSYLSSGVCWSVNHNPDVSGPGKTTDGTSSGDFTSSITGLSPDVDYFVRAYITSTKGTAYGTELNFRTRTVPAVTTTDPAGNAKNIPLGKTVSVTFNQTMISSTLTMSNFFLKAGTTSIPGSVEYSGTTATFTPTTTLSAGTVYTATVTTGVLAEGNVALPQNFVWSFTTVLLPVSPSSLLSNPLSATQIKLNWTDNSDGEDGFRIERSSNGSTGWTEIGTVTQNITTFNSTALSPSTIYYFRVRAYNSAGNSNYSNTSNATTMTLPVVSSAAVFGITSTGAMVSGTVNANGQSTTVTFEYGPTLDYGFSANASQGIITGSLSTTLTAAITGLLPGQTYHVRMKAISVSGTVTGTDSQFTTPEKVTDIDNNSYNTVKIGDAVWMAENLRTTKFSDNTTIPLVSDKTAWAALTTAGYCFYDNDASVNKSKFGALYNFFSVTRNVCPAGWHVPADSEWSTMIAFLTAGNYGYGGSGSDIAKAMSSTLGWPISTTAGAIGFDQSSNNTSGFTALPAGLRQSTGVYGLINTSAYFWSSSQFDLLNGWYYSFSYTDTGINRNSDSKTVGISVRCIKD